MCRESAICFLTAKSPMRDAPDFIHQSPYIGGISSVSAETSVLVCADHTASLIHCDTFLWLAAASSFRAATVSSSREILTLCLVLLGLVFLTIMLMLLSTLYLESLLFSYLHSSAKLYRFQDDSADAAYRKANRRDDAQSRHDFVEQSIRVIYGRHGFLHDFCSVRELAWCI